MSEGHQHANNYPLSKLWIECEIAKERINAKMKTEALLTQAVIGAVLVKSGANALKTLMDGLDNG